MWWGGCSALITPLSPTRAPCPEGPGGTLITRPETLYAGIVTVDGACVHIAALLNHPQDGFLMGPRAPRSPAAPTTLACLDPPPPNAAWPTQVHGVASARGCGVSLPPSGPRPSV